MESLTPQAALAVLERLYTNVSIYGNNAGVPSDVRDPWWGISPELLEQCKLAGDD